MFSEFDTLAADFCSDVLSEQFGARDEHGAFTKITYRPPQGEVFDLVGWIVSTADGQEVMDATTMQVDLAETLKITGPAADLSARQVTGYQRRATIQINGVEYNTDPLQTKFGGAMVTIGLIRKPLAAKNEMRHAGV